MDILWTLHAFLQQFNLRRPADPAPNDHQAFGCGSWTASTAATSFRGLWWHDRHSHRLRRMSSKPTNGLSLGQQHLGSEIELQLLLQLLLLLLLLNIRMDKNGAEGLSSDTA